MAAVVCIIIILGALRRRRNNRRPVRRSCWVRPWIRRRPQFGAFHALLKELSTEDPPSFKNFFQMDQTTFGELLTLVSPLIKTQDTLMREAISPAERFALTLRLVITISFLLVAIFSVYIIQEVA